MMPRPQRRQAWNLLSLSDMAESYNDGNRAFLQAFMARGTITLEDARTILAAIFTIQEGTAISPMLATRDGG